MRRFLFLGAWRMHRICERPVILALSLEKLFWQKQCGIGRCSVHCTKHCRPHHAGAACAHRNIDAAAVRALSVRRTTSRSDARNLIACVGLGLESQDNTQCLQ
jgi:hypothetical protein